MIKDIYPIKLYILSKRNLVMLSLALIINIATWLWLFLQIRPQQDYIFLHYNILFGVDYVGEWWKIIYVPITGTIIFIANLLLGWFFYGRDKFAATLFLVISIYCQIFLFISASLLVFLNV